MRRSLQRALFAAVILWPAGSRYASAQTFVDASDLIVASGQSELRTPFSASIVDINEDGLLDLYRLGRAYIQTEHGRFVENSSALGIIDTEAGTGAAHFIDFDNDGFRDLLVTNRTSRNSRYLKHLADGRFVPSNVSSNFQLSYAVIAIDFLDTSLDGTLDVIMNDPGGTGRLVRGLGTVFQDDTDRSRIEFPAGVCDISIVNHLKRPVSDVYVSVCEPDLETSKDQLFITRGDGILIPSVPRFGDPDRSNSGLSRAAVWADFTGDGWDDLYTVNHSVEPPPLLGPAGLNRFYVRNQDTSFSPAAGGESSGGRLEQGWTAIPGDFDNDGSVDLYVVNRASMSGQFPDHGHHLYRNLGDGFFIEVTDVALPDFTYPDTAAVATGDVNADGWLDLFVAGKSRDQLFLNQGGENHWLTVRAVGSTDNRDALGARVRLRIGRDTLEQEIRGSVGNASQNSDLMAHFGLGGATSVDSLIIHWPNGLDDHYDNIATDQVLTVHQSSGINSPPNPFALLTPSDDELIQISDGTIKFTWSPAEDPDGDTVRYTLHVVGPTTNLSFGGLRTTSRSLPPGQLRQRQRYFWTVTATDGVNVVSATTRRSFVFGESTVSAPIPVSSGVEALVRGDVQLRDLDGDGDPDLLLSGEAADGPHVQLFSAVDRILAGPAGDRNIKTFAPLGADVPGVTRGYVTFGDIDTDGDPDLLVGGLAGDGQLIAQAVNTIYLNDDGTFNQSVLVDIEPILDGAAEWLDIDADGDEDLAVTGELQNSRSGERLTIVYRNNAGSLAEMTRIQTGYTHGDLAQGDINSDGYPDLVAAGEVKPGTYRIDLYLNRSGTAFAPAQEIHADLVFPEIDLADYDLDGDIDMLIAGAVLGPDLLRAKSLIFRNDAGILREAAEGMDIPDLTLGDAVWLDFDGRGRLDVLISGTHTALGNPDARVYRSVENNRFADEVELVGLIQGAVAAADINGDGDQDFISMGRGSNGEPVIRLYLNMLIPDAIPPSIVE